jgi:hypothetical protein
MWVSRVGHPEVMYRTHPLVDSAAPFANSKIFPSETSSVISHEGKSRRKWQQMANYIPVGEVEEVDSHALPLHIARHMTFAECGKLKHSCQLCPSQCMCHEFFTGTKGRSMLLNKEAY